MPTRYLKPGICDSETLDACSPMAENLFYRLLVNVDDFGRLDARPAVIKSKCFPLKDDLSRKDVEVLLVELQEKNLIYLYEFDACIYLQMQKWDNIPRAKVSKFPSFEDNGAQMYTSALQVYTNVPLTVTVTETKTGTETATETVKDSQAKKNSPSQKLVAPKKTDLPNDPILQDACKLTWQHYSDSYQDRYGVAPVRNAKLSSQIKQFVQRVGMVDAPFVAAHYAQSNAGYYVSRGHSVNCLLADAEKLRTEWATGRSITTTRARQIDQTAANRTLVGDAMEILEKMQQGGGNAKNT